MSFLITSAKITGNPNFSGWAQVHDFRPQDIQKLEKRGLLFAVVATQKLASGIDSVSLGKEVLLRLNEEYYGDTLKTSFVALKNAIEKVSREFEENFGNLEIAALSILDNTIFISATKESRVSLFRKGVLADILTSSFQNKSASGYLEDGDIIILGTYHFFQIISEGSLKAALTNKSPQIGVELLAPTIHAVDAAGDVAAMFIKFEHKDTLISFNKNDQKPFKKTQEVKSSKLRTFFENIKTNLPEKKLYVRGQEKVLENAGNKKTTLLIGIITLTLLLISILFGLREKNQKQEKLEFEAKFSQASHSYDEAISLYSLNPERSRELFSESQKIVNELSSDKITDSKFIELREKLKENEGKILGIYKITPELFIDLSLLSDGFYGEKMSQEASDLIILDYNKAIIIYVSIPTKTSEIRAGPSLVKDAKDLAFYSDHPYLLKSEGIYDISDGNRKVIDKVSENDLIHAYAGNIYILEKNNSSIGRYAGGSEDFASKKEWLAPGIIADFKNIIDWAIDGNIWLLDVNGAIFKYSAGNPQPFSLSGVSPAILAPTSIYTNDELEYLYVLDANNGRVVVLTKEGDFLAQYFDDQIRGAKDFAVSEKEKKIIILSGEKLLSIKLEHL